MGEVWRAEHLALHSLVAVKLIEPRSASQEEIVRRFMQEARAAAALESPHVVRTTDFGVVDGTPYIVMELLVGESLAQRLERVQRISPVETARVIRHVARAVGKAHEAGFVHRDLKPDNIFIVVNDDEELVKVLDFGIAKAIGGSFGENAAKTRTGALLGTPYYMSPEQAQGDRSVDFRSDLWSMAIIAFECLTGTRPFDSEGLGSLVMQICTGPIPVPSQVAPVPAGFDQWFLRAVCRDPDGRFQSARELATSLRAVLVPAEAGEGTGTGRLQWPTPNASDQRADAYQSISGVTPMPVPGAGVADSSSASNALPGPLVRTTSGLGTSKVVLPMQRSGARLFVALAVFGVLGLAATGFVVRAVAKRASALPETRDTTLLTVSAREPAADEAPSALAASTNEPSAPPSASAAGQVRQPEKLGRPDKAEPPQQKDAGKPASAPTPSGKGRLGF